MKGSTEGSKATGQPSAGNKLPKEDPAQKKPTANQLVFGVAIPDYNIRRPRSKQMGVRATVVQSDTSSKLAIAAKATGW